jgi:hypothetical protein
MLPVTEAGTHHIDVHRRTRTADLPLAGRPILRSCAAPKENRPGAIGHLVCGHRTHPAPAAEFDGMGDGMRGFANRAANLAAPVQEQETVLRV